MELFFIDWKELAVVLSIVLSIGTLADLLIINDEWEKIKSRLFSKSLKIKSSSLNELMFSLAQAVLNFLDRTTKISPSRTDVKVSLIEKYLVWGVFLIFSIFILFMVFFNFTYLASLILVVPLLGLSFFWFILILIYEVTTNKWSDKGDSYWKTFSKTSVLSAIVTYVAVLLGSGIYLNFGISEFWFQKTGQVTTDVLRYNEVIGLINYPFDFLSLAFTYTCLKKITERKVYYPLLPLLDIVFSLILSSILYCVLYSLSEGSFSYSLLINDVRDLLVNGPDKSQYDLIYLLPIILSTFIPISLLGVIIFGLMFYKFVSLFFARVLHVLSEKESSIFKDIALTISAFIALINSIIACNVQP